MVMTVDARLGLTGLKIAGLRLLALLERLIAGSLARLGGYDGETGDGLAMPVGSRLGKLTGRHAFLPYPRLHVMVITHRVGNFRFEIFELLFTVIVQ